MKFGYASRLEEDTGRWVKKGLISSELAGTLLAETAVQRSRYSFSTVIIFLGVTCLCFAAMTFVAANWAQMPKLMRVALLIGTMFAAYGGAVIAKNSGRDTIGDALVLLGCGIFGAAIMLVGQMYHMQGKAEDAVLLWAAGSLVAVIATQSRGALWLSIALFTLWMWLDIQPYFWTSKSEINLIYPIAWLICAGLAWWLEAQKSAHLLASGLLFWMFLTIGILTQRYESATFAVSAFNGTFVAIGLVLLSRNVGNFLKGFEASLLSYLVIVIIALTAMWVALLAFTASSQEMAKFYGSISYIYLILIWLVSLGLAGYAAAVKSKHLYDIVFCAIWSGLGIVLISSIGKSIPFSSEAFALGLSIWIIRMGWRQDVAYISRLGYIAFAVVMLLIYFRTAGSLLGTSGFYLTAGILMVAGAVIFPKIIGRLKSGRAVE